MSQKSQFSLESLSLPARKRLLPALKGSALLALRLTRGQTKFPVLSESRLQMAVLNLLLG